MCNRQGLVSAALVQGRDVSCERFGVWQEWRLLDSASNALVRDPKEHRTKSRRRN